MHSYRPFESTEQIAELMMAAGDAEVLPRFLSVVPETKAMYGQFRETVTQADIQASNYLLRRVRPVWPGSYSEEDIGLDRFLYPELWQFDPLDGADEFWAGMMAGFAMHGAKLKRVGSSYLVTDGVIVLPGAQKVWRSENGSVVHEVNGKRVALPSLDRYTMRGYVRATDPNESAKSFYGVLGSLLHLPVDIVSSGGAGASFSELLEGKLNVLVMNYDYTKEWDVAMAEPLIRSQGGFLCDLEGHDFCYNRQDHFNRKGYVASIVFRKEEILPYLQSALLIKRL